MFINIPPNYNDPGQAEKRRYYRLLNEQKEEIKEYATSLGFVVYLDRSDKYQNLNRAIGNMQPKGNDYIQFVRKDPQNPELEQHATWYPGQGKFLHYHNSSDRFKR